MNKKLYGICSWLLFLLLLQPTKSAKVCKVVQDKRYLIDSWNRRILKLLENSQDIKDTADAIRTVARNFTLQYESEKITNDLNINLTELHQKQIKNKKEHLILLNSYNHDLEIVLRNKKEINEQLALENQKLRKEAERLIVEILHGPQNGSTKIESSLSLKGSPTWQRILLLAAKKGDVDEVKRLLQNGVDKNVRDDSLEQLTPLLIAAKYGRVNVVQLLLDEGVSQEDTSFFSLNTPLHEAASAGHLDICQLLLDQNAKLDLHNSNNETALQLAKKNNHQKVVDLLVNRGAKQ